MKPKPWEAKIPDGRIKLWWNNIDYSEKIWIINDKPQHYIIKGIHSDKHVKISLTDVGFEKSKEWIKLNKIPLINWQKFNYHKKKQWWYVFRFRNEESAMAFKLWIID